MTDPRAYFQSLGEDFAILESKEEQLITLRELGQDLPALDPGLQRDEFKVPGCASTTYVIVSLNPDGTLHIVGDSESFISKGYLRIYMEAFNGAEPQELIERAAPYVDAFSEKAGVRIGTVPSRANAFANIFSFMRKAAETLVASSA